MRIISQNELTKKLFDHPYANSPEYHAGMSVVHISDDGRLLIGYWHAPKGEVEINYGINVEYNYVISGKFLLSTAMEILFLPAPAISLNAAAKKAL